MEIDKSQITFINIETSDEDSIASVYPGLVNKNWGKVWHLRDGTIIAAYNKDGKFSVLDEYKHIFTPDFIKLYN